MLQPLHLITAGSVDDGKSTLIGRLLYDTQSLFSDQLADLKKASSSRNTALNLALITDGLRAERKGGITIDVGYRYFETRNRKIILADTPGHVEFTKNMVTAASNAEAAIILVDASRKITAQTNRHIILANLLGVKQFAICINKIDLVHYSQNRFNELVKELAPLIDSFPDATFHFVPTSALLGDNIALRSPNMLWYEGPTLLDLIETMPCEEHNNSESCFSVQWIINDSLCAGKVLSGSLKIGDEVLHIPSIQKAKISVINLGEEKLSEVHAPLSSSIGLDNTKKISRGDMLIKSRFPIHLSNTFRATLCWLGDEPMELEKKYLLQQQAKCVSCTTVKLFDTLDVVSNSRKPASGKILEQNEIGNVEVALVEPLLLRRYKDHRMLGSAIMIDPISNDTVGAILIEEVYE